MMPRLQSIKTCIARNTWLLLCILLVSSQLFAQDKTVTGRVMANDNDSTLAGVTVKVKGASVSTVTDANGMFRINASANSILVFSSVGFTTQEIRVGNSSALNVRMIIDPRSLQQVVVIGYGTVKRKDLTGSISSVTSDVIDKVPVTTVEQSLQGRAAGVQIVNNDASPGGNMSVLIRGIGSLAGGGNAPLYVIDGYPTNGGLNNINPNDIASIDILKDA
ncbi:MAG: TonB-dependent receptor plug domain-containing protein, partial [Bacteroidota bacterium]